MNRTRRAGVCVSAAFFLTTAAYAGGPALVRVDRGGPGDREALIAAGVPLVMEREDLFLALGDGSEIRRKAESLGRTGVVVEPDTTGFTFYAVGLRSGAATADLSACGEPVLAGEGWALLKTAGEL